MEIHELDVIETTDGRILTVMNDLNNGEAFICEDASVLKKPEEYIETHNEEWLPTITREDIKRVVYCADSGPTSNKPLLSLYGR